MRFARLFATAISYDRSVRTPLRMLVVLAIIAGVEASAKAAPVCGPAVRVSGDANVAAQIQSSLASRGMSDRGAEDCAPVEARVERRGDGLRVEVVDRYGRRSLRDVRDTATAVALIESWVRPEVVEDDLRPAAATTTSLGVVALAPSRSRPGAELAVLGGPAISGDDSTWAIGSIAMCSAVGPTCLGGKVEYARDTRTSGPGFHPRSTATAAVIAELPWRAGRLVVAPGLIAGPSWSRIGGNGPHMDQTIDDASLRAGGYLALRVAVAARWSIELELAGDDAVIGSGPGLARAAIGLRRGLW